MSGQRWFSAKARLVVLVDGTGATRYADSVFLFRAGDFEDAFARALALGRAQEEEFMGGEGQLVRWRLKEIVSLDVLGAEDLDGVEVYSEPVDLAPGDDIGFDASFTPETSKPTQTL